MTGLPLCSWKRALEAMVCLHEARAPWCGVFVATSENIDQAEQVLEMVNRVVKLKPKTVGFKGLSYKPGTSITEESHLLAIHDKLKKKGYTEKRFTGWRLWLRKDFL